MKVRVIGLGGYGKWVVTYLKKRLNEQESFRKDGAGPDDDIQLLSFDMRGQESDPQVLYTSYRVGESEQVSLRFPSSPQNQSFDADFYQYHGAWADELKKIRNGKGNSYISSFVSKDAAERFTLGGISQASAAGEVRLTSRVSLFLDYENIYRRLEKFLVGDSMTYLVSSVAGGTGSGSFLDFMLTIQDILSTKQRSTLITVLGLPATFESAKENESLDPLEANAYAAFRELSRINLKGSKLDVMYPGDRRPEKAWDVASRLVYVIDGSIVRGEKRQVKHYDASAPMVGDFILAARIKLSQQNQERLPEGTFVTGTMMDNMLTHIGTEMGSPHSLEHPEDAFTYATFGTGRMVFDERSVKEYLAQRLSKMFLVHWLAPSWLGGYRVTAKEGEGTVWKTGDAARRRVHEFSLSARGFISHMVYASKDAPPPQGASVNETSLLRAFNAAAEDARLNKRFMLSPVSLGNDAMKKQIRNARTLASAAHLLANSTGNLVGDMSLLDGQGAGDATRQPSDTSTAGILSWHSSHWQADFDENLHKTVIDTIQHEDLDKQQPYGYGGLRAAYDFLAALKAVYQSFLDSFRRACEADTDAKSGTDGQAASIDQLLKTSGSAGTTSKWDLRPSHPLTTEASRLVREYEGLARHESLKMMRSTTMRIVEYCSNSIDRVVDMVDSWIGTFEKGLSKLDRAAENLAGYRNSLLDIAVDSYVTTSDDEIERDILRNLLVPHVQDKGPIPASISPIEFVSLIKNDWRWLFNDRSASGVLASNDQDEGVLMCTLPQGMPDWQLVKQNEESVLSWNYQFAKYYLDACVLPNVRTDVVDVLMANKRLPQQVADEVQRMATPSLDYDDDVHKSLASGGMIDSRQSTYVYFDSNRWSKTPLPEKAAWVAAFKQAITAGKNAVPVPTDGEVGITATAMRSLISPGAMRNLQQCRSAYERFVADVVQLPVHVLRGENRAVSYEIALSKLLSQPYRMLHPSVVSGLDDEELLSDLLYARLLGMVSWGDRVDLAVGGDHVDELVIPGVTAGGVANREVTVPLPKGSGQSLCVASLLLRIPPLNQKPLYEETVKWLKQETPRACAEKGQEIVVAASGRYDSLVQMLSDHRGEPSRHPLQHDEACVELIMLARFLKRIEF